MAMFVDALSAARNSISNMMGKINNAYGDDPEGHLDHNFIAQSCLTLFDNNTSGQSTDFERPLFAAAMFRVNRHDVATLRHILITSRAFYHFHPNRYSEYRRRIPVENIQSLATTKHSLDCSVLCSDGYQSYDLRAISEAVRDKFITCLRQQVHSRTLRDLAITIVNEAVVAAESVEQLKESKVIDSHQIFAKLKAKSSNETPLACFRVLESSNVSEDTGFSLSAAVEWAFSSAWSSKLWLLTNANLYRLSSDGASVHDVHDILSLDALFLSARLVEGDAMLFVHLKAAPSSLRSIQHVRLRLSNKTDCNGLIKSLITQFRSNASRPLPVHRIHDQNALSRTPHCHLNGSVVLLRHAQLKNKSDDISLEDISIEESVLFCESMTLLNKKDDERIDCHVIVTDARIIAFEEFSYEQAIFDIPVGGVIGMTVSPTEDELKQPSKSPLTKAESPESVEKPSDALREQAKLVFSAAAAVAIAKSQSRSFFQAQIKHKNLDTVNVLAPASLSSSRIKSMVVDSTAPLNSYRSAPTMSSTLSSFTRASVSECAAPLSTSSDYDELHEAEVLIHAEVASWMDSVLDPPTTLHLIAPNPSVLSSFVTYVRTGAECYAPHRKFAHRVAAPGECLNQNVTRPIGMLNGRAMLKDLFEGNGGVSWRTEPIRFCEQLLKINEFGIRQPRHFLITSKYLYHFHPDSYLQARTVTHLAHISCVVLSTERRTEMSLRVESPDGKRSFDLIAPTEQVRTEFVDALRSFRDKTANHSADPTELAAILTSELSILEVPNLDSVSNATVSAYHKLNADKIFKLYSSTRQTQYSSSHVERALYCVAVLDSRVLSHCLITNLSLYLFHPDQYHVEKRATPIWHITSLVMPSDESALQLGICVNGEKDYLFATPSRSSLHSILSLLCTAFAKMTNFALSVVDSSLDSLCLTEEQVLLNKLTTKNEQGQSRPNGNAILAQLMQQTTKSTHIVPRMSTAVPAEEVDELSAFLESESFSDSASTISDVSSYFPTQRRRASTLPSHMRALLQKRQQTDATDEACSDDSDSDSDTISISPSLMSTNTINSTISLYRESCLYCDCVFRLEANAGPRVAVNSEQFADNSGVVEHWLISTRSLYAFNANQYHSPRRCILLVNVAKLVLARDSLELIVSVRSDYDEHIRFESEESRSSFVQAIVSHPSLASNAQTEFVRTVPAARIGKLASLTPLAVTNKCNSEAKQTVSNSEVTPQFRTVRDIAISILKSNATEVDFLNVSNDAHLQQYLYSVGDTTPHVLFSSECQKRQIGMFGYSQIRHFVLTAKALYNFKPANYSVAQRVIPLTRISSLVSSSTSPNLVVQVYSAHDYLLEFSEEHESRLAILIELLIAAHARAVVSVADSKQKPSIDPSVSKHQQMQPSDPVYKALDVHGNPVQLAHNRVDESDLSSYICTEDQVPQKLSDEAATRAKLLRSSLNAVVHPNR